MFEGRRRRQQVEEQTRQDQHEAWDRRLDEDAAKIEEMSTEELLHRAARAMVLGERAGLTNHVSAHYNEANAYSLFAVAALLRNDRPTQE